MARTFFPLSIGFDFVTMQRALPYPIKLTDDVKQRKQNIADSYIEGKESQRVSLLFLAYARTDLSVPRDYKKICGQVFTSSTQQIRELKKPRRRRQQQRHKTMISLVKRS